MNTKTGISMSKRAHAGEVDINKGFLEFAAKWNDAKSYPATYDLEHELGETFAVIQKMAEEYTRYRTENSDAGLPPLIWRRAVSGGTIAVPEEVLKQLDPFRIDADSVRNAKTIVVTSAQFGAPLNMHFWSAINHYAEAREALIVVMPIKYGPIRIATDDETGEAHLTSTFPDELRGRILFEDLSLCGGGLTMVGTYRCLRIMHIRVWLHIGLGNPFCSL